MSFVGEKHEAFELTSSGEVIAGVTNKRLAIFAIKLTCSAALTVKWQCGGVDLEGGQSYPATGGYVEFVTPPSYLFRCAYGSALSLNIVGTGTAAGRVSYYLED